MMTLSTYRTRPVLGLRREIDRLFDDVFGAEATTPAAWVPAVDIEETADAFVFTLEVPGIAPEAIDVTADHGVLRIRGERQDERRSREGRWHVTERSIGRFERSFQLPSSVSDEGITASSAHGVLTVRVPKAAPPTPRRIDVTAS